jgi:GNAT superfamily N-acetyltransferase
MAFFLEVMLKECAVTVVEDDTGIISFLAQQGEELRQLYTRPDCIGRGAGTRLIEAAKLSGVAALELWCFQANAKLIPVPFERGPRFCVISAMRMRRFVADDAHLVKKTGDLSWNHALEFEATEQIGLRFLGIGKLARFRAG